MNEHRMLQAIVALPILQFSQVIVSLVDTVLPL